MTLLRVTALCCASLWLLGRPAAARAGDEVVNWLLLDCGTTGGAQAAEQLKAGGSPAVSQLNDAAVQGPSSEILARRAESVRSLMVEMQTAVQQGNRWGATPEQVRVLQSRSVEDVVTRDTETFTRFYRKRALQGLGVVGGPEAVQALRTFIESSGDPNLLTVARTVLASISDGIPPLTVPTLTPNPNAAGWNKSDVSLVLTATDNDGGSGVKQIVYSATGAQPIGSTVMMGPVVSQVISAEGVTTVAFFATDNAGNAEPVNTVSIKVDNTPPSMACGVTPNVLWPPDHRLVNVTAIVKISDALSGGASARLESVVSNEPDNNLGDGDTINDIQGWAVQAADLDGILRAERSGRGTGRLYTVNYSANDQAGNTARCAVTVTVPHDKH